MQTVNRHSHDRLVAVAVENLQTLRVIDIKASHISGWTQPTQIGDYIPDVTGSLRGATLVVEAESDQGLSEQHTVDQWRTFSQHADRIGGYFIVVVNHADKPAAQTLLKHICGSATNAQVWSF